MSDIINQLLSWYRKNGRLLPWRETSDPYRIWLSEIMLQQTRVDQGLPYYTRFVEKFPDVFHLATATEQEVFKLWQGLGYYSRARNLLKTAQQVVSRFGGVFPSDLKTLQSLPGIGPYTAAAISSLAFGRPHPRGRWKCVPRNSPPVWRYNAHPIDESPQRICKNSTNPDACRPSGPLQPGHDGAGRSGMHP